MDVGAEIAQMVMESRGGSLTSDSGCVPPALIKEAEHIISMEVPLCIHAVIAHENCQRTAAHCANEVLIEVWTIKLKRNCRKDEKTLDILFLKNAVRSHLHFSQLNSWITNNGGKLPSGITLAYRLSLSEGVCLDGETFDFDETHSFPLARCGPSSCLLVSVKWKKRDSIPDLAPCSVSPYRYASDDWLLPSGSISSSLSSHSFSSPGSCSEPPRFFVSPDDDRFVSRRRCIFDTEGSGEDEIPAQICSTTPSSSPDESFISIHREKQKSSDSGDQQSLNGQPTRHRHCHNKKTRRRESHHSPSGPPKKRNSLDRSEALLDQSPTAQLLNAFDDLSSPGKGSGDNISLNGEHVIVGSTEVETLADFLATSSTISPLAASETSPSSSRRESLPRRSLIASAFRFMSSSSVAFSKKTGLPLNSSPAPLTRNERSVDSRFSTLQNTDDDSSASDNERLCAARSAPTSSGLLCNFEESALNGRLEPLAALDGFRLQIAASGTFCSPHLTLPVKTFFFNLSEDHAPSPYLGHCSLEHLGRKGYHIPKKGTLQATLFNPQGTVVRIFIVRFDVSEMPASSQTFLRQRTFFMPADCPIEKAQRSWLRYLIHLRLATDRRGRLYVHTDIRMLFSQKADLEALNLELEKDMQHYELRSFTEMPQMPKFSPRK